MNIENIDIVLKLIIILLIMIIVFIHLLILYKLHKEKTLKKLE